VIDSREGYVQNETFLRLPLSTIFTSAEIMAAIDKVRVLIVGDSGIQALAFLAFILLLKVGIICVCGGLTIDSSVL